MGESLETIESIAPHLRHAEGSAWFEPIPLGANLPRRAATANAEFARHYAHEYTHFLQSATTFWGANRMHTFFWSISDLSKALRTANGNLVDLDVEKFRAELRKKQAALALISKINLNEDVEGPMFTDAPLVGFQVLDMDDGRMPTFCRTYPGRGTLVTPISVVALEESMAMAVESWMDPEGTQRIYSFACALPNWQAFKYVVVQEALGDIAPHWDVATIRWMTVLICDVALNQYLPTFAFIMIMRELRSRTHDSTPMLSDVATLHRQLTAACHMETAEVDRIRLLDELSRVAARPGPDSAPFDHIFATYLGVFIEAMQVRANRPHAFVERLLTLSGSVADDLRRFEAIPFYSTRKELISALPDAELATAGLGMICLQDFTRALMKTAPLSVLRTRCPLFDRSGTCEYTKGQHCESTPWLAPIADGYSCIYRAATDAVGVLG